MARGSGRFVLQRSITERLNLGSSRQNGNGCRFVASHVSFGSGGRPPSRTRSSGRADPRQLVTRERLEHANHRCPTRPQCSTVGQDVKVTQRRRGRRPAAHLAVTTQQPSRGAVQHLDHAHNQLQGWLASKLHHVGDERRGNARPQGELPLRHLGCDKRGRQPISHLRKIHADTIAAYGIPHSMVRRT